MSLESALIRCCCIPIPSTPCAQLFAACFGWPPPQTVSVIVTAEVRGRFPDLYCPWVSTIDRNLSFGLTGVLADPNEPSFFGWPYYRVQGMANVSSIVRSIYGLYDFETGACGISYDSTLTVDASGECSGIVYCGQCPPVTVEGECPSGGFGGGGGGQPVVSPISITASITGSFAGLYTIQSLDEPVQKYAAQCGLGASILLDECGTTPCRCRVCNLGQPDYSMGASVSYSYQSGNGTSTGSFPFIAALCDESEGKNEYVFTGTARIIFS
jgi:hypothetical protein